MSTFDKLTDRVLSLLGLDLSFSISLARDPFNAIDDDLFLGARPEREHVPALRDAGVTHVVSCLPEEARPRVSFLQEHFRALFLPMRDGMNDDIAAVFPTFFDFVRGAREGNADAKLFVHCEVGVSRSATLVTALVMQRTGMPFYDAYCAVRAKRGEVLPNIGFASQLQRLERDMLPRPAGEPTVSSLARYLREVCNVPADVETIQGMLDDHDDDAVRAIRAIFGGEIPRVVQGARA